MKNIKKEILFILAIISLNLFLNNSVYSMKKENPYGTYSRRQTKYTFANEQKLNLKHNFQIIKNKNTNDKKHFIDTTTKQVSYRIYKQIIQTLNEFKLIKNKFNISNFKKELNNYIKQIFNSFLNSDSKTLNLFPTIKCNCINSENSFIYTGPLYLIQKIIFNIANTNQNIDLYEINKLKNILIQELIISLVKEISMYVPIEILNISYNELTELPIKLLYVLKDYCPYLKKIDFSENNIIEIPDEISLLQGLEVINAHRNGVFCKIPTNEILKLTKLKWFLHPEYSQNITRGEYSIDFSNFKTRLNNLTDANRQKNPDPVCRRLF